MYKHLKNNSGVLLALAVLGIVLVAVTVPFLLSFSESATKTKTFLSDSEKIVWALNSTVHRSYADEFVDDTLENGLPKSELLAKTAGVETEKIGVPISLASNTVDINKKVYKTLMLQKAFYTGKIDVASVPDYNKLNYEVGLSMPGISIVNDKVWAWDKFGSVYSEDLAALKKTDIKPLCWDIIEVDGEPVLLSRDFKAYRISDEQELFGDFFTANWSGNDLGGALLLDLTGEVNILSRSNVKTLLETDATPLIGISAGKTHALALNKDGALYGWGTNNTNYQLATTTFYKAMNKTLPISINLVKSAEEGGIVRVNITDLGYNHPNPSVSIKTFIKDYYLAGVPNNHNNKNNCDDPDCNLCKYLQVGNDGKTVVMPPLILTEDTPIKDLRVFVDTNTKAGIKINNQDQYKCIISPVGGGEPTYVFEGVFNTTGNGKNDNPFFDIWKHITFGGVASTSVIASGAYNVDFYHSKKNKNEYNPIPSENYIYGKDELGGLIAPVYSLIKGNGDVWLYHVLNASDTLSDISNFFGIAAGEDFSVVVASAPSNIKVLAWGKNDVGQLGRNATSTAEINSMEIIFPSGVTDEIRSVVAGKDHALLLTNGGIVYAWGKGVLAPTVVTGLSNIIAVSAGENICAALSKTGQVYRWTAGLSPTIVALSGQKLSF
ncbi:MAG: hypothetical protein ACOX2I_13060 [Candidatus Ozemobacteraceae bacterium]|jgi:hypothetical protein